MTEKKQAVGSIWNVNSWHWQMKNYTDISKKILQDKLLKLELDAGNGIKITHTKVRFPKAEAQVNVRKGKQILVYQFELQLDTLAQNDEEQSKGSYRVKEILNDDLEDMIIEDVKSTEKNKCGQQQKKCLKKSVKRQIVAIFKQLQKQLNQIQGDPKKLQQDKKKRQQAINATHKAREQKGAQKQKLLEQQRAKQRKLKEQAYRQNFAQRQGQ